MSYFLLCALILSFTYLPVGHVFPVVEVVVPQINVGVQSLPDAALYVKLVLFVWKMLNQIKCD